MEHNVNPEGLEDALSKFERDAGAAVKALSGALREAKKLQSAALHGHLRDLRSGIDTSARLADEAADAVRDLRGAWTFDEVAHFVDGGFAKELLALGEQENLKAVESDDRILSYPVIVRISAGDSTVVIDKVRERRVRPSELVARLKALQVRPPRFKAEAFIEALVAAYDLALAGKGLRPGSTAKLVDVYSVLTLMPGASREYSKQEFARDLYLLDQSGVVTTRDGRNLSLPASALTRATSGVLSTVTRSGQAKMYAGISFEGPGR
jgi:hypothetical protein